MATYRQIQNWVKRREGFVPKTCWIAHILAEHGRTHRMAANRIDPSMRQNPCPQSKRPSIEAALRHFEND
jgi:hypothetical protein